MEYVVLCLGGSIMAFVFYKCNLFVEERREKKCEEQVFMDDIINEVNDIKESYEESYIDEDYVTI